MPLVDAIFAALGGPSKVAAGIRAPVQTVHTWKRKGSIPSWRRPALLDMVRRERAALDSAALAYLADAAQTAEA